MRSFNAEKVAQALMSLARAAERPLGLVNNVASTEALANAAHAGHGMLAQTQHATDMGLAAADLTATGGPMAAKALAGAAPAASRGMAAAGAGAGRVVPALWAASYGVDAMRSVADPQGAMHRTEAATQTLPGRPVRQTVNTLVHGAAQPFTSMGSAVTAAGQLAGAGYDAFKAQRSSAATARAVADRAGRVQASRIMPPAPVTGVNSNMPTITQPAPKQAQAIPHAVQMARLAGDTKALSAMGRAGGRARKFNLDSIKRAVEAHMRHPDVKHVMSWMDEAKEASAPPASVRLQFASKDGTVKASALVEIADTPRLRAMGLSKRAGLGDDRGMFFDKAGTYWMKDVAFPLDIVFVDKSGAVLDKCAMAVEADPSAPTRHYGSPTKAAHAIELPLGWCDRNGVTVGDVVTATRT